MITEMRARWMQWCAEWIATAITIFGGFVASTLLARTAVRMDSTESGPVSAYFAVARRWKGAPVDTIAVVVRQARVGPSTCEIDVRVGASYLVFARPRGAEQLQTHRCDGTTLEEHAGATLRILRRFESAAPEV